MYCLTTVSITSTGNRPLHCLHRRWQQQYFSITFFGGQSAGRYQLPACWGNRWLLLPKSGTCLKSEGGSIPGLWNELSEVISKNMKCSYTWGPYSGSESQKLHLVWWHSKPGCTRVQVSTRPLNVPRNCGNSAISVHKCVQCRGCGIMMLHQAGMAVSVSRGTIMPHVWTLFIECAINS